MHGYVLIDKPKGWTSFDVVARVRSLLRAAHSREIHSADGGKGVQPQPVGKRIKVGHTGTLDPLATGLLVILAGSYTKRAPELTKLDKTYEIVMKLGATSTTGDEEGEKQLVSDREPIPQELQVALAGFTGQIMQTPPAYSAMKVNGVRAYKLARQGKKVALQARPVTIHSLTLTDYTYPYVRLTADVSSGTYIRSLVEDIGAKLGVGAYMADLRRTRVGPFKIEDAVTVDALPSDNLTLREL